MPRCEHAVARRLAGDTATAACASARGWDSGRPSVPGTSMQPITRPSGVQTVNVQYTPLSNSCTPRQSEPSRGSVKRGTGTLIMMYWPGSTSRSQRQVFPRGNSPSGARSVPAAWGRGAGTLPGPPELHQDSDGKCQCSQQDEKPQTARSFHRATPVLGMKVSESGGPAVPASTADKPAPRPTAATTELPRRDRNSTQRARTDDSKSRATPGRPAALRYIGLKLVS